MSLSAPKRTVVSQSMNLLDSFWKIYKNMTTHVGACVVFLWNDFMAFPVSKDRLGMPSLLSVFDERWIDTQLQWRLDLAYFIICELSDSGRNLGTNTQIGVSVAEVVVGLWQDVLSNECLISLCSLIAVIVVLWIPTLGMPQCRWLSPRAGPSLRPMPSLQLTM